MPLWLLSKVTQQEPMQPRYEKYETYMDLPPIADDRYQSGHGQPRLETETGQTRNAKRKRVRPAQPHKFDLRLERDSLHARSP